PGGEVRAFPLRAWIRGGRQRRRDRAARGGNPLMCGRMTIGKDDPRDVASAVGARLDPTLEAEWKPRYNVAPTQRHPVLVVEDSVRWVRGYSWGLRRQGEGKPL